MYAHLSLPRIRFLIATCIAMFSSTVVSAEPVSFRRDVAPLLLTHCVACHGPKKAEGGYRVDTFAQVTSAGDSTSPGFTAKDLETSESFRRMVSQDKDERMPKDGEPLPKEVIAVFENWIKEGANFDGPDPKTPLASYIPAPTHPAAPEKYARPIPVTAVALSPDGSELLVGGYHEVTVWSPVDGKLLRRIGGVGQRVFAITMSPDGKTMAVASGAPGQQGEVRVLEIASGNLVRALALSSDVVFDVVYSPSGDRIATASADGMIRVFETSSGNEQLTISSHSDWVFAVAFSSDGSKLASASRDKTAKAYDAATGNLLITYSNHQNPVRGVLFHPDGSEVFSSAADNKVQRWKIADANRTGERGAGGEVYKLVASGDSFVAPSADKKVRRYITAELKDVREYQGASDAVLAAAWHEPSKRVVGGCFDGRVFVWNADDGQIVTQFDAAPGYAPSP
ncbi:WD-40 repeat protein [Pirellula staleyi DSM 6068]|uniref:WD-40 repeat protein n=1 Tax=Pirellula staleyi (strain ATCC 27377 / DSM 6068 / ICPB 4128) TaxID=530564 RepID=D2QX66_PIRSD|nr:c-type cytochrome domain-containing protein [Pirellula staleyi]ADB17906.1 WD-40 repeat protein [Pirellula staleyi DSM 6068]